MTARLVVFAIALSATKPRAPRGPSPNVLATWTVAILSIKRLALRIKCAVRSFGTLEAMRSLGYLSRNCEIIGLPFQDKRVSSWRERKIGVLGTQQ